MCIALGEEGVCHMAAHLSPSSQGMEVLQGWIEHRERVSAEWCSEGGTVH